MGSNQRLTAILVFTLIVAFTLTISAGNAFASTVHSVSGYAYIDTNHNGKLDANEQHIIRLQVTLFDNKGKVVGKQYTSSQGYYSFKNLATGSYKIVGAVPTGYVNTTPSNIFFNVKSTTGPITTSFGYAPKPATVVGLRYDDLNKNGKYDPGEPGLSGWTIKLESLSSSGIKSVVTSGGGAFKFTGLAPGKYLISEVLKSGYTNTSPTSKIITLTAGQTLNVTSSYGLFGNVQNKPVGGTIVGVKYLDVNSNRKFDKGDATLSNWTINLLNGSGQIGSVKTDAKGFFKFTNLSPGQYTIKEVLQPGYTNSTPLSMTITLTAGQTLNVTSSYGLFGSAAKNATIEGLTYNDLNRNGKYDPGEPGLSNWAITLNDPQTQLTSSGGNFNFSVLPGTYIISEAIKSGYTNTSPTSKTVTVKAGQTINLTSSFGSFGNRPITAYVTNYVGDSVSVINTATNTVTATIPVGLDPWAIAVTQDGKKVYAGSISGNTISVINTATNTVTATIPVGNNPWGVAFNPAGTKAYVTNRYDNDVSVINALTNTVTATIPVGNQPNYVAFSPDGTKAYVTNYGSNNVSVINALTNTVTATIPVGHQPADVAFSPDGTKAYVTNGADNNVSVINVLTNTVTATIPVGNGPDGVQFRPGGKKAYVTNVGDNTISVINTLTNTVTATIPVGQTPFGVAFTPDGTTAYCVDFSDYAVSVINASTDKVTTSIPVAGCPAQIAIA